MGRGYRKVLIWELESLLEDCPNKDQVLDKVEDLIDDCESAFNDIKDNLNIDGLSDLHKIDDAYLIAVRMSDKLY